MTQVNLKDDFYSFVNDKWLSETMIPSDKSRYGTFNILDDMTKDKLKKLIEDAIMHKDKNYKKIGVLYNQGLKLDRTNYIREIKLVNHILNHIDLSFSNNILFDNITNMDIRFGITMPFCLYVGADFVDSNMNILYLSSSGLGLSREYYLIDKPDYINKREEYKIFLKKYSEKFQLTIDIDEFYNLEKKLAEKTFSKEDKRNIDKVNNPITWEEFIKLYPNFSFIKQILSESKITEDNINKCKLNIGNLEYFHLLNDMIDIKNNNLELWKQYFKLKFVLDINSYLSEEIYLVYFDFYGKIMNGKKEPEPLWKRSIDKCENVLGELIGNIYRQTYFSKESKHKAETLVDFIKTELNTTLVNLSWMEQQTKNKALAKLNKMKVKIGYPEKLEKNYDTLVIDQNKTYLENMLWSNIFLNKYELSYLYKPVNKDKWSMFSYEVNAYYNPSLNEIVFPAGILQEPFFSYNQSDEKNFGGIGTVIGHEITHGFDDQGSRFDENGNLNDWWSNNDKQKYKERTTIIQNQYNNFSIEGNNVNGKLTLGENIADIGGVHIAYKALQNYLIQNNKLNGNLKDFFINYANIWKNKTTSEYTKELLLNDPHSPAIFRVNGTLSNIDEFYKLFDINEGDKLFIPKENRGEIWI
jgi:endothelin-converting enzyme/putative endopeptidase